jgi:large subunit ribosomal protein L10
MRKEKQLLLNEIKEKIDASQSLIVTSYEKLEPNVSWKLRDHLTKSGGFLEIVRKKVFVKAAQQSGIPVDESLLKGHIGVIFINQADSIPSTQVIFKFSEENGKIFEVLFGQIEGKNVPGKDLEIISKLPGMNEMRASILGLLVSPMSQMLAVLEAIMAGPLSIIEQKSE